MAYLGETSTPKLWKRMKAYINNRIANLEQGITMELLWENASPTSSFAAQTINVDLRECDEYRIVFSSNKDDTVKQDTTVPVGHRMALATPTGQTLGERKVTYNSNGSLSFDGASRHDAIGHTYGSYNEYCIPYQIYGIKGVK